MNQIMPILEKEEACQPNAKNNVLEEAGGGGAVPGYVGDLGKRVGKVRTHKPPSKALTSYFGLQPLLQVGGEETVCLRQNERGPVIFCPSTTNHHIPQKGSAGAVWKSPAQVMWMSHLAYLDSVSLFVK